MSFKERAGMVNPADSFGGPKWRCPDKEGRSIDNEILSDDEILSHDEILSQDEILSHDEIFSDESMEQVLEESELARDSGHAAGLVLPGITDQRQRDSIKGRVKELFKFEIKPEQLEALHHLIIRKQDLILIAGTSFGKSLIFQAAPLILGTDNMCLVIMPLKAIEQEQDLGLQAIPTAKPFVLDGEHNTKQNLLKIARGSFTHGRNMQNKLIVTANISWCLQVQR